MSVDTTAVDTPEVLASIDAAANFLLRQARVSVVGSKKTGSLAFWCAKLHEAKVTPLLLTSFQMQRACLRVPRILVADGPGGETNILRDSTVLLGGIGERELALLARHRPSPEVVTVAGLRSASKEERGQRCDGCHTYVEKLETQGDRDLCPRCLGARFDLSRALVRVCEGCGVETKRQPVPQGSRDLCAECLQHLPVDSKGLPVLEMP